jgi:hypothetical protein
MTDQTTAETARALLWRHGLPEDVIDGALALHAQELAAVQRRDAAVWGVDTDAGKHRLSAADLIDPTRGECTPPAVQVPAADRAAAEAVTRTLNVLRIWRDERETGPEAARLLYEVGAALTEEPTAVLPAPTDQTAVLRWAADRIDNEELPHDYVDLFDNGARWAARLLRRLADEAQPTEAQPPGGYTSRACRHCWTGIHWINGEWVHADGPRGHAPEPPSLPAEPAAARQTAPQP